MPLHIYGEEITATKPRLKRFFVYFFVWFVYVAVCFILARQNIYFIRLWHSIAYLCWRCR